MIFLLINYIIIRYKKDIKAFNHEHIATIKSNIKSNRSRDYDANLLTRKNGMFKYSICIMYANCSSMFAAFMQKFHSSLIESSYV